MFNLQSGRYRQSFPALQGGPPSRNCSRDGPGKSVEAKHNKAVTGLMVDGLNQTVISCGLDGQIKVSISAYPIWISLGKQL